ncbi:2632_t:CDS:2, partial [Dentiscutata heterogama]
QKFVVTVVIGYSTTFLPGYQCSCNNIFLEIVADPNSKSKIFVFEIGSSSLQNFKKGGPGYKSSLIREYCSKKTLFVLIIDDSKCFLKIYQEFQLINRIREQTPDEAKNESKIIELTTSLQEIYLAYYQFSDREFSAWQTLIRAAGGHNITLWSHDESE